MNPILGEYSEHFFPDNGIAKLGGTRKMWFHVRGRLAGTFVHQIGGRQANTIICCEKIQLNGMTDLEE